MGWVMTAIAGLTAFYMFRLYYGIFWGAENRELHVAHKPHEAPLTMTLPLVFLAAVTCVAGFIPFGEFVSSDGAPYVIHIDRSVAAVSLCVAAAAIALATWMYARDRQPWPTGWPRRSSGLHRAAYRRFYIDEVLSVHHPSGDFSPTSRRPLRGSTAMVVPFGFHESPRPWRCKRRRLAHPRMQSGSVALLTVPRRCVGLIDPISRPSIRTSYEYIYLCFPPFRFRDDVGSVVSKSTRQIHTVMVAGFRCPWRWPSCSWCSTGCAAGETAQILFTESRVQALLNIHYAGRRRHFR